MITYKTATQPNKNAIAKLHAQSWQDNYKGILSDDYLDNQVEKERLEIWTNRFLCPTDNQHIITAKANNQLCGFVCLYAHKDPNYGTLLDNLHVDKNWKRKGIGKELMSLAGQWTQQYSPNKGMYLWVFATNTSARQFYERLGGKLIEVIPYELMDGSGRYGDTARYYWEKPGEI